MKPFLPSLLLLSVVQAVPVAKDFVVKGLVDEEPAFAAFEGDMFAGVLPVDPVMEEDDDQLGHMMFWYFDSEEPRVDDTLIVWFNGGPGCSSFDAGLLFEFGPAVTPSRPAGYFGGAKERHDPLGPNPYAWTKASDILFIEQPVGVGFSYGGREPQTENDVASDFTGFLQNFYDTFPGTREKRLFLVGESYGGMYIAGIAHFINQQNKKLTSENSDRQINLGGIGIGNAWVDASIQGKAVIDYAWWHGMIDSVTRDAMHEEWKNCFKPGSISQDPQPKPFHTFTVPDECGIMAAVMAAAGAGQFEWGSPSIYDVSTWDKYDLINSANSTIESFFNNPRIREALNVPESAGEWSGCIPGAGRRRLFEQPRHLHLLDFDKPLSMASYISELLDDADIPVLVYNGDRDLSTNSQGSELFLNGVEWSGSEAWLDPSLYERGLWMVDSYPAGYSKTVGNLNFVIVYNSGHLVPMNQPVAAYDLIIRFLEGDSFIDRDLPKYDPRDFSNGGKGPSADRNDWGSFQDGRASWPMLFVTFVIGFCVSQIVSCLKRRKNEYTPISNV